MKIMTEKIKEENPVTDFHFASEGDEVLGIETAEYANGNLVKRFKLSTGATAVVRELFGRDSMAIDKLLAGENNEEKRQEQYFHWGYHFAVTIDGKQLPMETFGNLKARDYNKIKLAYMALNF